VFEMSDEKGLAEIHPTGESATAGIPPAEMATSVDTFAGKVQRKWVPEAAVSSLGLMPFFIECLKTSGGFEGWAEECPLPYTSPHAPRKREVLGTMLLSVWAGQGRYAHIKAMRGDGVNPEWLGRRKVASEDSLRRALPGRSEEDSEQWRKRHVKASYEPLLEEPWILATDATVKPLYGHREEAKLGCNPSQPGRPWHVYHSYFLANLGLVREGEGQAGNQSASSFAQPELWALLDGLGERSRPAFWRGDGNWGTERAMQAAEQRQLPYGCKLKQRAKVQRLLERLFGKEEWVEAGQPWQGLSTGLRRAGGSKAGVWSCCGGPCERRRLRKRMRTSGSERTSS
jgi:hypothetical protein